MQSVDPFPKLIWKFHYNFDFSTIDDEVRKLQSQTPSNSKLEAGAAFSTASAPFDPPHTWHEFKDFREWLYGPLDKVWQEHKFNPKVPSTILNSWINTHGQGGVTLEHNHNRCALVVAWYLKLPKDSGFIEFRDPLEYHKSNLPFHPEEELWKEVPCKTGDLLIFPNWLKHRTQPNFTTEERVVFTLNVG